MPITMDFLNSIPDWVGEAATGLVFTVFGVALKAIWDAYKHYRLPFKRDKERYDYIIATPQLYRALDHLRDGQASCVSTSAIDDLEMFFAKMNTLMIPAHANRRLRLKEDRLLKSLRNILDFFVRTQPHPSGLAQALPNTKEGREQYSKLLKCLISALKAYRDYGAQLFAEKMKN